jgi:hypothetical protein
MEQQDMFEASYIYESPDGGNTIYRRKMGEPHHTRELVRQIESEYADYRTWVYKQDWEELSKNPAVKDQLDKLKTIVALVDE